MFLEYKQSIKYFFNHSLCHVSVFTKCKKQQMFN